MDKLLEKIVSDAISGSREVIRKQDDLEQMFEMWTGYMVPRIGLEAFLDRINVYDDRTFNLDGYQPTVVPVPLNLIDGMTSIGVDAIRPNLDIQSAISGALMTVSQVASQCVLMEEAKGMVWLIFTVIEQGHPLKGLRYTAGMRDDRLTIVHDDPLFTANYDEDDIVIGGLGLFIDKRERFLRAARPDIFKSDPKGVDIP